MSKIVTATVKFLVDDDSSEDLMNALANNSEWVNEGWFEKHRTEIWEDVNKWEVGEVYSETSNGYLI